MGDLVQGELRSTLDMPSSRVDDMRLENSYAWVHHILRTIQPVFRIDQFVWA